jgi:hypothetical protein
MANVLGSTRRVTIISALAEGSSIRSIERITGVHRDTIMRLGVRVGKGCATLLDRKVRDLPCEDLEFDELWGFIGKKERHVTVLHIHPVTLPILAVRAAIVQEFNNAETAEG